MLQRRYPVLNLGQPIRKTLLPPQFILARDTLAKQFLGNFGVVLVEDGTYNGKLFLSVMSTDPKAAAEKISAQFMGYPVLVTHSGPIEAQ